MIKYENDNPEGGECNQTKIEQQIMHTLEMHKYMKLWRITEYTKSQNSSDFNSTKTNPNRDIQSNLLFSPTCSFSTEVF